ncbi:hypothetical protein BsWGS_28112 [Bradybaena similaris]
MTGNVDHCATLTFILLTFSLTVNQGQGQKRTCDLFSRPHPNGLCGTKLAKAHENLCFLIRQSYPEFFPQNKRSQVLNIDDLSDLPLPALKDVLIPDDRFNADPAVVPETPVSLTRNGNQISSLTTGDNPEDQSTTTILHVLNRRNTRPRRSLVCECCYGPCSTRILARYC